MSRLFTCLAALCALIAAVPASATQRPVQVTVAATADGITITYELPAPAASLAIGEDDRPWPSDARRLAEPGLRVETRAITGSAPFRRATLAITPDARDVDARYPVLTRIEGRGYALFAPYMLPSSGPYRLRVDIGGGRFRTVSDKEARGGYVIVGAQPRAGRAFHALSGTDIDAAAETFLHDRVGRLIAFYGERLGISLDRRPTIVVTRKAAPQPGFSGFRGDVTPNGVVMLSFRGLPPSPADPSAAGQVTGFLAHEIFHLWNAPGGDAPAADAWLHEGSADYYSWLSTAALWPQEIDLAGRLQRAWNSCMVFGGTHPIANMKPSLRYSCGALAHWAVDLGVRRASGGARDGFDLWARLLRGDEAKRGYDLAAFRTAAADLAPGTADLLAAFIDTGWDWPEAARQLSAAGADVVVGPPTVHAIRFAAARAIGTTICAQYGGAGDANGTFFMTGQDCGGLDGQVHLVRAAGHDPMADAQLFYDRVRGICAQGGALALTLRGTGEPVDRTATCTAPVEAPKPDIRIVRALPLNPPARSAP